jgi:hypothetical protein
MMDRFMDMTKFKTVQDGLAPFSVSCLDQDQE